MHDPAASRLHSLIGREHFGVTTEHEQLVRLRLKPVKGISTTPTRAVPRSTSTLCIFQTSVQHSQRTVLSEAQKNFRPERYLRPPDPGAQYLPFLEHWKLGRRWLDWLSIDRQVIFDVMDGSRLRASVVSNK